MALEIKRRPDGGIVLCAPVCTRLSREDVTMLDKQAREYHTRLHGTATSGSALGPDILGDDVGMQSPLGSRRRKRRYAKSVQQVEIVKPKKKKKKWWQKVTSGIKDVATFVPRHAGEIAKGAMKSGMPAGGLMMGDVFVGDYIDNPGGHIEIMGDVSNREFLRERQHMGGYYETGGDRFPAEDMGMLISPLAQRRSDNSVRRWAQGVNWRYEAIKAGDAKRARRQLRKNQRRSKRYRHRTGKDIRTRAIELGLKFPDKPMFDQLKTGTSTSRPAWTTRPSWTARAAVSPPDITSMTSEDPAAFQRATKEAGDLIRSLGESGRPINGGLLAGYIRLNSRSRSIETKQPTSAETRQEWDRVLRQSFAGRGWQVLGMSDVSQEWTSGAPAPGFTRGYQT